MKIYGLKVFYYVKSMETHIKFILCGINNKNEKITIELDKEYLKINKVTNFNGFSLIFKDLSLIKIPYEDISLIEYNEEPKSLEIVENDIFNLELYLSLHKDDYYNFILDNINTFSRTIKYKSNRPVWFFKGTNYIAKNYIARLTNISKYIVDRYNFIPDLIECDIIVFPDKYFIDEQLLKTRCIGNNEYISVSFESKMSNNINYPFWKNRYIYIFLGLPNTGKTYISNSLGLNVFKTDNYSNLPNYIEEDIVIIGKNKIYDIDIDIIPRFRGNCYFTFVEFDFI
jgi:hypothetical protein